MRFALAAALLLVGSIMGKPASADPDDTDVELQASVGASTTKFDSSQLQAVIAETMNSQFLASLNTKSALAFSDDDIKQSVQDAKRAFTSVKAETGDSNVFYDIVVQVGHYDRKTGRTGGQGRLVNEQEMAALVADTMTESLSKLRINNRAVKFVVIKADNYADKLRSTLFISLHTDASDSPCSVGPSVGFDPAKSAVGMHFFALALAITLGLDAEKFMKDNYTPNLKGYYAYKKSAATYSAGVLEMSELTCPDDEKRLLGNARKLAHNLSVATQFAIRGQK